jgi:hypothetical protein
MLIVFNVFKKSTVTNKSQVSIATLRLKKEKRIRNRVCTNFPRIAILCFILFPAMLLYLFSSLFKRPCTLYLHSCMFHAIPDCLSIFCLQHLSLQCHGIGTIHFLLSEFQFSEYNNII